MTTAERIDIAKSIATLATKVESIQQTTAALGGKVDAGNAQSNQQNTEILKCIAVLTSKSEDSTKYQDECDKDRKAIRDDVRRDFEDLEKKVNANSMAINTLTTRAATVSSIISLVIAFGAIIVEGWRH